MAGQLTHRWNQLIWGQISHLLEDPPVSAPTAPQRARKPRQIQRRLPEATWAQIIVEYEAGASASSLARIYDVDPQTVLNRLVAHGITPRPNPRAILIGPVLEEAQRLRAEGWNKSQLARRYGVSRTAVDKALKRALKNEAAR